MSFEQLLKEDLNGGQTAKEGENWEKVAEKIQEIVDGFFVVREETRKLTEGFGYLPKIQPTIDVKAFICAQLATVRSQTRAATVRECVGVVEKMMLTFKKEGLKMDDLDFRAVKDRTADALRSLITKE